MDMTLFEKDGKTYTRLKISIKNFWKWKPYIKAKYGVDTDNPSKKSSRFIYFEVEGDLIHWAESKS